MTLVKSFGVGLIGAAVLGIGSAQATLQFTADNNGVQTFAQDQVTVVAPPITTADGDPTLNALLLGSGAPIDLGGGIFVASSFHTAAQGPGAQILNSSSLDVYNTNATPVTATVAISATGFTGPANTFSASGSGTFQNALGGTITDRWYDDPANAQGALPGACTLVNTCNSPGTLLGTDSFTNTGSPNSYSFNFGGPVHDTGPFSMTLEFTFTLPGGTGGCSATNLTACPNLSSRGQALQKTFVPEPASLGLLGVGLIGLGMVARRRR